MRQESVWRIRPVYNVVGVVNTVFHAARGKPLASSSDEARASRYSGFRHGSRPRLVSFESCGGTASTNHVFDLQQLTMILSPNSLQREAGRSINKAIGFRLPQDLPGYPACELTAGAVLLPAVSNTAAPPIFVRWLLSLPRCHGETPIVDSPAAILDPVGRSSGRPRPAGSASSDFLVG